MDTFCLILTIVLTHPVTSVSMNVVVLNVSETEPNGTIVWNNTAEENCTWKSSDPIEIKEYFRLTSNWSQLVLVKPLDLEVLEYYINKPTVTILLLCPSEKQITIHIYLENELAPEFPNSPYTTSVKEETGNHNINRFTDASFSQVVYRDLSRTIAIYPTTSPNQSIFTNDSSDTNSFWILILCIIVPISEAVLLTIIVVLFHLKWRAKGMVNCERKIKNDDPNSCGNTVDSSPSTKETQTDFDDIYNTIDIEPYDNNISRDTINMPAVYLDVNASGYTDLTITNVKDSIYTHL